MKQSLVKGIRKNALLIIALALFVIFAGNKNPVNKIDIAAQIAARCCSGYSIGMGKLKQFMLDSLRTNRFEGGIYSKASLIAAINQIPGDSVYLMNVLKNCNVSQATDLAITSPQATAVTFAKRPSCYPCPGKACCPQKACVASINRSCINYQVYNGFTEVAGK